MKTSKQLENTVAMDDVALVKNQSETVPRTVHC